MNVNDKSVIMCRYHIIISLPQKVNNLCINSENVFQKYFICGRLLLYEFQFRQFSIEEICVECVFCRI